MKFGPPEYFALALLGLMMVVYLSEGSAVKGAIMGALGLAAATVGLDPVNGGERFTFNIVQLRDGLELVPVAMGLFGISEIMLNLEQAREQGRPQANHQQTVAYA